MFDSDQYKRDKSTEKTKKTDRSRNRKVSPEPTQSPANLILKKNSPRYKQLNIKSPRKTIDKMNQTSPQATKLSDRADVTIRLSPEKSLMSINNSLDTQTMSPK